MAVIGIVKSSNLQNTWDPSFYLGDPEQAQRELDNALLMLKTAKSLIKSRKRTLLLEKKKRQVSKAKTTH